MLRQIYEFVRVDRAEDSDSIAVMAYPLLESMGVQGGRDLIMCI